MAYEKRQGRCSSLSSDAVCARADRSPALAPRRCRVPTLATALTALVLLCGCAGIPDGAERAARERDVAEVVLRDLFSFVGTSVICVELYGSDPDDAFLKRFSDQSRPVRRRSACDWNGDHPYTRQLVELSTGLPAVILGVNTATWHSDRELAVEGEYTCGALCAAVYSYDMVLSNDHWTIAKRTLKAIS
jgi:hypothetical protein